MLISPLDTAEALTSPNAGSMLLSAMTEEIEKDWEKGTIQGRSQAVGRGLTIAVPILKSLNAAKTTKTVGKVAGKTAQETAEEAAERVARETAQEATERAARETAERSAKETAQETTKETAKTDDITTVKRGDNNGADGSGVKIRGEVDETKVGEVKVTSAEGNKIGGDGVQTSGPVPETKFKALNDGIKEKFLDAASEIRKVDEALDSKLLENMNKKRNLLSSRLKKKINFGYAEVNLDFSISSEFFAQSSIHKPSDLSQIVKDRIGKISYQSENPIFKTKKVNGENIVDGMGAWDRIVDTESKILEDIANS